LLNDLGNLIRGPFGAGCTPLFLLCEAGINTAHALGCSEQGSLGTTLLRGVPSFVTYTRTTLVTSFHDKHSVQSHRGSDVQEIAWDLEANLLIYTIALIWCEQWTFWFC